MNYYLKPSGGQRSDYLEYLLQRLTKFRQAGDSFGQKRKSQISVPVTRKIIQSQLSWPLLDETHFEETCAHIQAKIDDTIVGRRNVAQGIPSYHSFAEHGKPKSVQSETAETTTRVAVDDKPKSSASETPQSTTRVADQLPVQQPSPAPLVTQTARSFRPTFRNGRQPNAAPCRDIPPTVGVCATVADELRNVSVTPNAQEAAWLWHTAFETVEALLKSGKSEKKTKRSLIRFLALHASFLGRNESTLRWGFNRKLSHWRMHGRTAACLVDRRSAANAKRRVQLPDADRDKIIARALFKHGGEVAPAFRDCLESGELSPEVNGRYLLNPSRRSHLPEAVTRAVMSETKLLLPHFHGPRQARLNGAFIERDWSKVGAGDWYSSDDFTLEVYFYLPDEHGGWALSRGQFLPMIDERSKRILDFVLVPEKHYTGINVRTLINKVSDRYGLPRCGFYLENGLWKNSKLVGGAVPIGELKLNFAKRLGLELDHTKPGNARAKVVENVGKLFQARLRGELGWVGPNEQVLKLERIQSAKLDVESGRKHPAEAGFLSLDQWCKRLAELCEEYNATPQDSKVIGARLSPDEAWRLLQTRNDAGDVVPLTKLPEDCRYLLATHMRPMRIGRNGISLPKSLGGGTYRSEITGQLQGRQVNVYFDLELPEMISLVTDQHQVFTVPRAPTCPAHDATPEEIAAAQASVSAHTQYARQRISQLRSEYMPPTRANIVDPRTSAVGREMKAQKEKAVERQQANQRARNRTNKVAHEIGLHSCAVADARSAELIKQGL